MVIEEQEISLVRYRAAGEEFAGVHQAAFASKPAPTLDLFRSKIPCGSGLAREEALSGSTKITRAAANL
ncbi:hypothetical protein FHG55_27260 [Pseudomonas jessenii]|uniref:Uncharacterized protein n=1 Tax=Pseudomonas jessenii TaxID=77298 RepID=A0A5C4KPS5_PSEJE|nr:hypothetical protein FHG55_27260 [Pseudomonas jessenii]